ncbi:Phosphate transport system permease protein PstC [Lacunisphaera limnophila]|uniref:Phosphate transport system permease protein n=1 Tax=Lacunisphaera limnophila TaxID=1838286 RepID=A0A1D8AWG4_9BACT|nr:phosphate ABC transporter permease subunit PstC [Lacunisphaera limnophila]AOS45227.1 Phosphate transport system permease protein PstC [Lacunisphaera limnophila]
MPSENATATAPGRVPTRQALLTKRGGWFFGLTGEQIAKLLFQGNAAISIVVLGLITFTIFRDAVTFLPQNQDNLRIYRLAGLEFVDILRGQVTEHSTLSRYLLKIRSDEQQRLSKAGQDFAAVNAQLAGFDALANTFADAALEHETILGEMTDHVSAVKDRYTVASDLMQARQNLLAAAAQDPARAATLQKQAEAYEIEQIDFTAEIAPLVARRPEVQAANQKLELALQQATASIAQLTDANQRLALARFQEHLATYRASIASTEERMLAWDQAKPVGWHESLSAFLFGRRWLTASFWQDWYGVIPLFMGSMIIAVLALSIAIPLGVAAAVYVNQVATSSEQKFIKPTIEFIAAIPSVVLGFFGIAVFGETLRRVSQVEWLSWVPGFPMLERLNATTAACLLALMAIPTIFSLAEDAINNVPRSFKEASLALGATRLQTIIRITIPAALSGIMAAILLGFGRVVGETMVVLLCAGNRIEIPDFSAGLGAIFQPVHTMTGIIAQEMGEVVRNSIHYRALFMVGVVLFLISLLINWLAQKIVRRYRISIG